MMEMDIKRLDHLGLVAGVIKDLKLIDQHLPQDEKNEVHITMEAIAGILTMNEPRCSRRFY